MDSAYILRHRKMLKLNELKVVDLGTGFQLSEVNLQAKIEASSKQSEANTANLEAIMLPISK